MSPVPLVGPVARRLLMEVSLQWDRMCAPSVLLLEPFAELHREGWRGTLLPPVVSGGVVGLTLSSVEMGLLFVVVLVPFALFFYWVISNLRRLQRTASAIHADLHAIVGLDPAAAKRLQDTHRARLVSRQH